MLEVGEERHIYFDQELQLVYLLGTAHLSRTGKSCETDEDFCMTLPLEVHPRLYNLAAIYQPELFSPNEHVDKHT